MTRKQRVLSDPAGRILQYFVDRSTEEIHGFAIIRETGISASTLYPSLRQLSEQRGLLVFRWEDNPVPGRPARRLYRLNAARAVEAQTELSQLADHKRRLTTPRSGLRPRSVT
jgi:DNA-binding PadR family transcriptional regulator